MTTNASGMALSRPARVAVTPATSLVWGDNGSGQLGLGFSGGSATPAHDTDIAAVLAAAGAEHSVVLGGDGSARLVGANGSGQLGTGNTTPRSSFGTLGFPGNLVGIAAGGNHTLLLDRYGQLYATGDNASGQLGVGGTPQRLSPSGVNGGDNVVAVAAGDAHSLFIKDDGSLWATGDNTHGQLGDGLPWTRYQPTTVAQRTIAAAAGGSHSLFIKDDGSLWAMGANDQGQLGDGTTTPRLTPAPAKPVQIASLASGPAAAHVLGIGALVYDFVYDILGDGSAVITGYVGEGGDIVIPGQLNGMTVAAIADGAFIGAWGLSSVHIPATVTNVGAFAFAYCPSLVSITVDSENPAFQSLDGVLFSLDGTVLVQYPVGRGGVYTLPEGVETIAAGAFAGADGLTTVIVPASATAIGDSAFAACANLAAVYFRGNAPTIGEDVFDKNPGVVYYSPSASGWGATFGGLDAIAWSATVEGSAGFGMQNGEFGFTITGANGLIVVVEAADNLSSPVWTPVSTQTLSNGSAPFADPASSSKPNRFYRLSMP